MPEAKACAVVEKVFDCDEPIVNFHFDRRSYEPVADAIGAKLLPLSTVATFTCGHPHNKLVPEGDGDAARKRICQQDGTWTGEPMACVGEQSVQ